MPTSSDAPSIEGLTLLARAVSGRLLDVKLGEAGSGRTYVSGNCLIVDGERLGPSIRTEVAVQAAMLSAGSLERRHVRQLLGRSGACARYCAMEGVRSVELLHHRLPPSVLRATSALRDVPRTTSAEESLRLALSKPSLPPAPESFGLIRPSRNALSAARPTSAQNARDPGTDTVAEPQAPEDGIEAKTLERLASPTNRVNPFTKLFQRLFESSGTPSDTAGSTAGGSPTTAVAGRRQGGPRGVMRLASAVVAFAAPHRSDTRYPEWDESRGAYRPDWVSVHELEPWDPDHFRDVATLASELPGHPAHRLARGLVRAVLTEASSGRSSFGEQLHVDGVIDLGRWRRIGDGPQPLPFMGTRRERPDAAVMVLLDASSSTQDTADHDAASRWSVFDQHLALAYQVTCALDLLGAPVAFLGFRSWGRHEVHVLPIKGFGERVSAKTLERVGHLHPGGFTRMGAAIRHASTILERRAPQTKRLLIVVSDGLPYDQEGYESVHATADTRRALTEARGRGTGCLCIGVTPFALSGGPDQHAFDAASALHVGSVDEIEERVGPLVYRALHDTRRRMDHLAHPSPQNA